MEKLKDFVFISHAVFFGMFFCVSFLLMVDTIIDTVIDNNFISLSYIVFFILTLITAVGNFFLQD